MEQTYRSACPVASALDVVGDKWSLVIVRSMLAGATRYGDFLAAPEKISTNILADRLRRLEAADIIARIGEEASRPRYRLTRKGADLLPAIQALARWGCAHLEGRWRPPDWFEQASPAEFYPDEGSGGAAW
jgi:DNA-binding HxlR family transcriptional regulator